MQKGILKEREQTRTELLPQDVDSGAFETTISELKEHENEMNNFDRLLSMIIHQVRNHCMSVKGYTSLLSYDDGVSDTARNWISKINLGLCSLEEFLSGFESYRLSKVPTFQPVRLRFAVRSALQLLGKEKTEILKVSIDIGEEAEIVGDPADIRKMLYHAIKNSVEALGDKTTNGEIIIRFVDGESGKWVIEVIDNGCGMSQQQVIKAKELLYTTKNGHIGCGLNFIISAASRIGACVEIESLKGYGTTLRIKKL